MVNSIIAKINGRNKVIDFRDGLVPANVDDYAMLHGVGGKDHAASSVIKIYLCDYSAGTGSKSRTVSANISPELCEQIFEVCKRNIGNQVIPNNFDFFTEQRTANKKLALLGDMCFGVLNNVTKVLSRYTGASETGEAPSAGKVTKGLLTLLNKTKERAEAGPQAIAYPASMLLPQHMDFSHTQDRVHNYKSKTGGGDIAPVQRLQIWHTTYRKQGGLGNYPWTIKVINGKAKVRVQPNGATTFDASSMTEVEEAFIQVSDTDMFRAMGRVTHFVSVWENLVASEVVTQGRAKREEERKEYLGSRTTGEASAEAQANTVPEAQPEDGPAT